MISALLILASAQASPVPASDSVSMTGLTGLIVGVLGAVAALINAIKAKEAKAKGIAEGRKQEKQERSVSITGQPVGVQLSEPALTWTHHSALEQRVGTLERAFEKERDEQARQWKILIEAGADREIRITEKLGNKLDGIARELHRRLDDHFGPKTRTRQ